jgi:DNA-binding XRE family transcriptional regulator
VARFDREAALIDEKKRALYESEKAKGTDPLEILNKLYDFENSQSYEYQEATGAGWRGEIAAFSQSGKTSESVDLQTLRSEIDVRRRALIESEKTKAAERLEMLASLIKAGRQALIVPEKEEETDPLEMLRKMIDSADEQPQGT